jgi:menaquinone-dependent protoporphyrinogen IX oxidase
VAYYSRKGSNRYLAEKIAQRLKCNIEEIRPRLNVLPLLLLKMTFGIRSFKHDIKETDIVILCGPIYMGSLIAPLRNFINKYSADISRLVFVTCCGSTDEKKDEKFGYGFVFKEIKEILQDKCVLCQAFPITLVLSEAEKEDTDAFMNTHLNDENFNGEIVKRFDQLLSQISEM